jgi:hypothetical protein
MNIYLFKGVMLIVTIAFFFGAYLLENLGISYVAEGGTPIFKIHIYSYLTILLFSFLVISYDVKYIIEKMGDFFKVWLISLSCLIFVIVFGLFKFGLSGMAYLVDTFLSPLLVLAIVFTLTHEQKHRLLTYIAYLLLLNCLVSVGEYALTMRLIDVEFKSFSYFRATAFLTHPLNNSLISIAILPLVLSQTRVPSIIYLGISILALFAFGGRAALGIYLVTMFFIALPVVYKFITNGVRVSKLKFSLLFLLTYFLIIIFIIVVFETGIADRIISKMYLDDSAFARIDVFYLLEQLSLNEWFFGASENLRSSIEIYLGITVIENYIIGWIYTFGLIGAIPLFVSFIYPLFFFFIKGKWPIKLTIMGFLIVALSNNSLNTKTVTLFFLYLVLLLVYLLRRKEQHEVI